jgi:2-methylcitrate dehydratase PrpD
MAIPANWTTSSGPSNHQEERMTSAAVAIRDVEVTTSDLVVDLSHFAATIDVARLDAAVIKAVKTNILDTLSCALAGSSAKAIAEVSGLVREWGGAAQADLFVFGGKFPAHHAAWVNGGMSHARDYDDTHDAAVLHTGVSSVPAAIAAGQLRGDRSGRRSDRSGRGRSRSDLPPRRRHPTRSH